MLPPIAIAAIGRLKSGPQAELAGDYARRIAPSPRILEYEPRARDAAAMRREENQWLQTQAASHKGIAVALDRSGRQAASEDIAALLEACAREATPPLFLIGGADGMTEETLKACGRRIAFGLITLPHQLARVLLFEQLYRAQCILGGHPYHK